MCAKSVSVICQLTHRLNVKLVVMIDSLQPGETLETGVFEDDEGFVLVKVEGQVICRIPASKKSIANWSWLKVANVVLIIYSFKYKRKKPWSNST